MVAEMVSVDWLGPRAVALREAMEIEMGAIYAPSFGRYPREVQNLLTSAFDVEYSTIVATVIAVVGDVSVGHAGLRPYDDRGSLEVKKVVVDPAHRGRGISRSLMLELERIAHERGAPSLLLQTGDLQPAAISLYESLDYQLIPSYPPFHLLANALCYEKVLSAG